MKKKSCDRLLIEKSFSIPILTTTCKLNNPNGKNKKTVLIDIYPLISFVIKNLRHICDTSL